MPSRRVLRIVTVLGVIAVVQTIGILVYRGVE